MSNYQDDLTNLTLSYRIYLLNQGGVALGRPCQFPGCLNRLSDNVPLQINFCSPHQYLILLIKKKMRDLGISQSDRQFILEHLSGCSIKELSARLDIPQRTMLGWCQRSIIQFERAEPAARNKDSYIIPLSEIIRVIDDVRNGIPIYRAASILGLKDGTFFYYYRAGLFGVPKKNLSNFWVVNRSELPVIQKTYLKVKKDRDKKRGQVRLKKDEVTVSMLCSYLGVHKRTARHWIMRRKLRARRRGRWWIIKKKDLKVFLLKVLTGELKIKCDLRKFQRLFMAV